MRFFGPIPRIIFCSFFFHLLLGVYVCASTDKIVDTDIRLYGWDPISRSSSGNFEGSKRKNITKKKFFYKAGESYKPIVIEQGVTSSKFRYVGPTKFVMYTKTKGEFVSISSANISLDAKDVIVLVIFIPNAKNLNPLNCITVEQSHLDAGQLLFINLAKAKIQFRLGPNFESSLNPLDKIVFNMTKIPDPGERLVAAIQEKNEKWKIFKTLFFLKPQNNQANLVVFYPFTLNGKVRHSFHVIPVKKGSDS